MRIHPKLLIGLSTSFVVVLFTLPSYAIKVTVQSSSKGVTALGYTVNGKKSGGAGGSYKNTDAPTGKYLFGVRAGGDVPCATKEGKKAMTLKKDTTVTLTYNGKTCIMVLSTDNGKAPTENKAAE
jgi:hypothetical protein